MSEEKVFDLMEAANELTAEDSGTDDVSTEVSDVDGQAETNPLENTEEADPRDILNKVGQETVNNEAVAQAIEQINQMGAIHNGLPIKIDSPDQLKEIIQKAFLKSSAVNYGGVTSTDVSVHVAYVNSNSGTNRAVTSALHQATLGGCSEGEEKPTLVIMRQGVMNSFIELLKPHQRTTRESTLDNLGHGGNTLVYSGVDHIVDNLAPDASMIFLNEKYVRLYAHPEYKMKRVQKEDLETQDAMLERLFLKGVYACSVLRYQGLGKDIAVA